jgi:hypothetical protein
MTRNNMTMSAGAGRLERTIALVETDRCPHWRARLEELNAAAALSRVHEAEHRARAVERALAPRPQWVEAEAVERPTGWQALADAVTDAKVMYPAAIGWLAGCVAAAIWNESWPRIVLTGAVVALAGAVFGAVRAWRATRAVTKAPGSCE